MVNADEASPDNDTKAHPIPIPRAPAPIRNGDSPGIALGEDTDTNVSARRRRTGLFYNGDFEFFLLACSQVLYNAYIDTRAIFFSNIVFTIPGQGALSGMQARGTVLLGGAYNLVQQLA